VSAGAKAGPLLLAAGIVGLGLLFLVGAFGIAGESAYAAVGPRAFPTVIGTALTVLGLLLGIGILGGRVELSPESGEDVDASRPADLRAIAWIVAGLVVAALLIERAGFPLTAAVLFTVTARAFGSRRLLRDAAIGLVLAALTWLVFARGLGVTLPGGPLG
jgi:putative tricarboxylic transport membrane protein